MGLTMRDIPFTQEFSSYLIYESYPIYCILLIMTAGNGCHTWFCLLQNGSAFHTIDNWITETKAGICSMMLQRTGLSSCKNSPVIHQDIKPDNILINDENRYHDYRSGISARIRSTLRRNQKQESSGGTLAHKGTRTFGPSPPLLWLVTFSHWSSNMSYNRMPPGDHEAYCKTVQTFHLSTKTFLKNKDIIYKCSAPA